MKKIFLIFDQLPHKKDGGLIATYVRFIQTFSDKYEISIVSIFNNGGNDIEELDSTPIINFRIQYRQSLFQSCFLPKKRPFQRLPSRYF